MSSSTLALGRALTKRIRRDTSGSNPSRPGNGAISRNQISAPLELISTTNVLAYTAPDIRSASNSSASSSSISSGDDWDLTRAFLNTPNTSPELSSAETSPTCAEPEPNHLTSYFNGTRSATTAGTSRRSAPSDEATSPAIPSRARSHTVKAHVALARHRSLSRTRGDLPPTRLSTTATVTRSTEMFDVDFHHPFGKELEQVNEVAEDFGVTEKILDEEEQILRRKGLKKFAAGDYLMEIEDLYGSVYEDRLIQTAWI